MDVLWVLLAAVIIVLIHLRNVIVPSLIVVKLWLQHLWVEVEQLEPHFVQLGHLAVCHEDEVSKPICLKLLIEKERNEVLFAESNGDFVDVLFSFLTVPVGLILKLAEKKSGLGSMDALYKSIEKLDEQYFQTSACRTMLLHPKSAYGFQCNNLAVKVDDTEPAKCYVCSNRFCSNEDLGLYRARAASVVKNDMCVCGLLMDDEVYLKYMEESAELNGMCVKSTERFIISDDLQVTPISVSNSLSVLQKLGFKDGTAVEERTVKVGNEEVLHILLRSLLSGTPITDVFILKKENVENIYLPESLNIQDQYRVHSKRCSSSNRMKVKLLPSKSTGRALCSEAREDFVDLLFSFLTLPLGSIINPLKGNTSMGSMDNLYQSVKNLSTENYMKSRECVEMLLSPKLPKNFGCDNQLLRIEEETLA